MFKQSLADCIYEELYHYYYDCSTNNTELQEEITSMNENQSTKKTFQRDSTLMANDIENAAITTKNENFSDSCTNGKFFTCLCYES